MPGPIPTSALASTDDVLDIMDGYVLSAALNAAMELGLFWRLDQSPLDTAEIAASLSVPLARCRYWLALLEDAGLLVQNDGCYQPSDPCRQFVLNVYSHDCWSSLAGMAGDRLASVMGLTRTIHCKGSVWTEPGRILNQDQPPNFYQQVLHDPDAASRLTRMLGETHRDLAEALADHLDLSRAGRVMDLGGGSGVVLMALLRRHINLRGVVLDVANVCDVGRTIAAEQELSDRLSYVAADFERDALPSGFDMVICCDTGPYSDALFARIADSLVSGGRLVLVEQFPGNRSVLQPPWLTWSFRSSLHDPAYALPRREDVIGPLGRAGFRITRCSDLPVRQDIRWARGWTVVEAELPHG